MCAHRTVGTTIAKVPWYTNLVQVGRGPEVEVDELAALPKEAERARLQAEGRVEDSPKKKKEKENQ